MNKFFLAASVATAAVMGASAASAATFPITVTEGTNFFGNTGLSNGTDLSDTFTFTLDSAAYANASAVTVSLFGKQDVDFSSITLDGYSFTKLLGDPLETWFLDATLLTPGLKSLVLNYNVSGTSEGQLASYSGTINIAAVPEPATWLTMIAGFGLVGFQLRRARNKVATVVA